MASLARYWHTVRHLKPVQVYGRVGFRLRRPRPDLSTAPPRRALSGSWVEPVRRPASLIGENRFRFLNEVRELGESWEPPADKLWTYNLHYFDDLNASGAELRSEWHQRLIRRWVSDNAPGVGTGWEPYPTSLRVVNWIKWALGGSGMPPGSEHSLAVQARWLADRVEHHLLGNHLLANAKALVFAGLFFDGPEARAWLDEGTRILDREVPEQILPDGGHIERSPMYHALVLEDLLDLVNATTAYADAVPAGLRRVAADWPDRIQPMRRWLSAMCHPDGDIAFFNDAALGIAATAADLDGYASRLGVHRPRGRFGRVTQLTPSGYIRLEDADAVAILDVAPVCANHLPAHAHADTLSFELSLFAQRVLVNSGTSRYGAGAERLRQRGTAAHNTVVVDGEDSSEVWGAFRVGRRARPLDLRVLDGETAVVGCSHDGYRRLSGHPVHRRQWALGARELVITDELSGVFARAEARFHVHPSVSLAPGEESILVLPGGQQVRFSVEGGMVRRVGSTWHPAFGASVPTKCLAVDFANRLTTRLTW